MIKLLTSHQKCSATMIYDVIRGKLSSAIIKSRGKLKLKCKKHLTVLTKFLNCWYFNRNQ